MITGTGDAGLKLVPTSGLPTLQISGDPTQLPLQIAALTRDIGKLAQASAATATRTQALPGLAEGRQSIDQLGIGSPSATGVAAATVTLGLSQVQLGSDAQALTLRLIGSTSLPGGSADGAAVLTASVAGRVLSSWRAESDSTFAQTVTVPWSSLGRYVTVDVTATATGTSALCGDPGVVSLSVDGSSAVTAEPADRPLNDGFAEFPAVLRPVYQVATDRTDVTGLDTVVGMVAALQRLSTVPLSPTLVDVAALGSSDQPGVLIAARSAVPASLALPLDHTAAGVTLANGDALTVDADLASLQVVDQDARTVLVATSTQPSSTAYAAMLTWLRAGDHLGSIGGDVLVWPADGDHQTLAVVGGGERTIDAAAEPLWQQRTVQLLAISVVLAVIVGLLAFLLLRGRGGAVRSGDSTADRRSGGREPVTAGYARRADDRPARRAEDRRTEPAAEHAVGAGGRRAG